MNEMRSDALADYYEPADTWMADRERAQASSRKVLLIVAAVVSAIALLEAAALVLLLPLKTVVPYTLLVDRQTGYVQALKPLEREIVAPDTALVRSFIAQYVIAREGFDIDSLRDTYRKVGLWSAGEARDSYIASMQATNPASPIATLPRRALIEVQIRSVTALNADTLFVRYSTFRTDPGGQRQAPRIWAAAIKYRFSGDAMSADDRLLNPLGFQVLQYRRNEELAPPELPVAPASPAVPAMMPGGRSAPNSTIPLPGAQTNAPMPRPAP